jgi:CPA1 family monovalent cation:H+ antiporter
VVFQFGWTFGVWILDEQLHLSGIITLVVFAMATSRTASEIIPARIRIPSWAVWEVTVFVLNVLAFILVGFQLKSIAARLTGSAGAHYATVAAAVCGAVILARLVWVTGAAAFSRWRCRPREGRPGPKDAVALDRRSALLIGWCGMRGTVTIAAALALPSAFPYRDLMLVTAFGVVLGTLVLQGLTLRPVLLALRLEDDGTVDHEIRLARVESLRAALNAAVCCPGAETAELVRHRYQLQLRRAEQEFAAEDGNGRRIATSPATLDEADPQDGDTAAVRAATEAQRKRLFELRSDGTIGDAAFQRVQEELDWAELDWAQLLQAGQPADGEG